MKTARRRDFLLALGCASIAGAATYAQPRRIIADYSDKRLEDLFPAQFGRWRPSKAPTDIIPETVDASRLYEQTLTRTYVASGEAPVMMVLAYRAPESREMKVHRPETCYRVAGFQISERLPVNLKLSQARRLGAVTFRAERGPRVEDVIYWSRVTDKFPQSLDEQRWDMFKLALSGVLSDGLLARFSTLSASSTKASARSSLQAFARAFVDAAPALGRALLIGGLSTVPTGAVAQDEGDT